MTPRERTRIKRMMHSAMLAREVERKNMRPWPAWSAKYARAAHRYDRFLAFEERCMRALS